MNALKVFGANKSAQLPFHDTVLECGEKLLTILEQGFYIRFLEQKEQMELNRLFMPIVYLYYEGDELVFSICKPGLFQPSRFSVKKALISNKPLDNPLNPEQARSLVHTFAQHATAKTDFEPEISRFKESNAQSKFFSSKIAGKKGLRPAIKAEVPPNIAELIKNGWNSYEEQRPSVAEIVSCLSSFHQSL